MLMMLPFEAPTIFEGIHKSYFRMPRVVKDQRNKFENDDLFRQLSHEGAVKYTGFKDRPLEERQMKFIANCQEGHTEVSVVQSGNQFTLMFNPTANPAYNNEGCDFDKELGKVHIKSGFILNGVCVLWRGWIDLQRLEGFGCLEFDEYRAYLEDAMLKQQIDKQQSCNNANQTIPSLGRLNHHPLGGPQLGHSAVATNSMPPPPPVGFNPSTCLGPTGALPAGSLPPPPPPPAGQPPVSLADSAAHYGNAAIAAAAAAAFHQALAVGGSAPGGHPLHGLGAPPGSTLAAAAAAAAAASANGPAQSMVPSHLSTYANGAPIIPVSSIVAAVNRTSPPLHHAHLLNGSSQHNNNGCTPPRHNNQSPERENQQQQLRRQATKRAQEEQTQLDDVDVVSDISAHDLDFPPRRIFKTEQLTTAAHHHHRAAARRAA